MHRSELSSSLNARKCKVVLLGDSGVGKSSIIDRFVRGEYDHQNQPTVGIDFLSRNIVSAGKPYRLQLWDTAGQEKYKSLVPAYLRDADCGLLVFEIGRRDSFENVRGWLALFREHAPSSSVIIMLANKSDVLPLASSDYTDSVHSFRQDEQILLIETSAKSGLNINLVFETMISRLEGEAVGEEEELKRISESEEDNKATSFCLKYNRAEFEQKKHRCCFI